MDERQRRTTEQPLRALRCRFRRLSQVCGDSARQFANEPARSIRIIRSDEQSSHFRTISSTAGTPMAGDLLRRFAGGGFRYRAFIGFGLLGAKPFKILQHIAGGIFGSRSSEMGWTSALIGLACHFTIALTGQSLLSGEPQAASSARTARHLRTVVWRACLFVYVLCRFTDFCAWPGKVQYCDLHHWARRSPASGRIAQCALRAAFRSTMMLFAERTRIPHPGAADR